MLTPYKIKDYCKEFNPTWAVQMPDGCPPEDIFVPSEHPFYRLAKQTDTYNAEDFKSYSEVDPAKNWGEQLPLAVGLSFTLTWWRTSTFQMLNLKMLQI